MVPRLDLQLWAWQSKILRVHQVAEEGVQLEDSKGEKEGDEVENEELQQVWWEDEGYLPGEVSREEA